MAAHAECAELRVPPARYGGRRVMPARTLRTAERLWRTVLSLRAEAMASALSVVTSTRGLEAASVRPQHRVVREAPQTQMGSEDNYEAEMPVTTQRQVPSPLPRSTVLLPSRVAGRAAQSWKPLRSRCREPGAWCVLSVSLTAWPRRPQ